MSFFFVDLNLDMRNQEVENVTVKIHNENDDDDQVCFIFEIFYIKINSQILFFKILFSINSFIVFEIVIKKSRSCEIYYS